jgi:hypothetical protein
MKMETCGQRVVAVPEHHCRTTSFCHEECGEQREFVCGSDNKFYRNECEMKRDNCGYVHKVKTKLTQYDVSRVLLHVGTYIDERNNMEYIIQHIESI